MRRWRCSGGMDRQTSEPDRRGFLPVGTRLPSMIVGDPTPLRFCEVVVGRRRGDCGGVELCKPWQLSALGSTGSEQRRTRVRELKSNCGP